MEEPVRTLDFDHAAATRMRPEVLEAMLPFLGEEYGNPSSVHAKGRAARIALDRASDTIAAILGCTAQELVFTGSATEALNLAVRGIAEGRGSGHLIASAIEHHAVLEPIRHLTEHGFTATIVAPDAEGVVSAAAVGNALRDDTILVAVMAANNEIGTIQPTGETAGVLGGRAPFLVDASQAAGWIDVSLAALGADLLALNAAKIGGPKGIGLLVVPDGTALVPQIRGGGQQHRRRSGTENLPAIVGFARALELAEADRVAVAARITSLRECLWAELQTFIPDAILNGSMTHRLPGNLHVSFPGIDAESLVLSLDRRGVLCSSGAACTTPMVEPSHVLEAMGLPKELVRSGVRFSLGRETTEEEVDALGGILIEEIERLRRT